MQLRFFLNPLQFNAAAHAAGIAWTHANDLYSTAVAALNRLTSDQIKQKGTPRPLTPRAIPASARSPLREALERQNADRAAAVEVQILDNVFVTFCAGVIADVRITAPAPSAPAPL